MKAVVENVLRSLRFAARAQRLSIFASAAILNVLSTTGSPVSATTWYVSTSGQDTNPGTLSAPFLTIQRGLNVAQNGDTVLIGGGTFTGQGNFDLNLKGKAITVQGNSAFTVSGASLVPNTVINLNYVFGNDGFEITSGETRASVIKNLTIWNGNWNGAGTGTGAAIDISGSSPTIVNCILGGNTAIYGGAMGVENGSNPLIENCNFNSNVATNTGGAMIIYANSKPVIVNCLFDYNKAGNGGGIEIYASSAPIITGCTFTDNSANLGEALHLGQGSTATVTNSILYGDTGTSSEVSLDAGNSITVNYSDVQGGYVGSHNVNSNPNFYDGVYLQAVPKPPTLCIGSGTVSAPDYTSTDWVGELHANPPSMGALENEPVQVTPVLTSVSPNQGTDGQAELIYLSGNTFNSSTVAYLVLNGTSYLLPTVQVWGSTTLLAATIPSNLPTFTTLQTGSIQLFNSPGYFVPYDSGSVPFYLYP